MTTWNEFDRVGDRGGYGPTGARGADSRDIPGGRLTLVSGNPIPRTDTTAATTLFYTPYMSSQIVLYDTTRSQWVFSYCPELSVSLAGLTTSQPYDVFVYLDENNKLALELLAWTSNSARATAIILQDGAYVKSGSASHRFVGTVQMQATGQGEDSILRRYVFNMYNRVRRQLKRAEATSSWTYTTTTWRQANAAVANQVSLVNGNVSGMAEMLVSLKLISTSGASGSGLPYAEREVAFGVDSTTAPHADCVYASGGSGVEGALLALLDHFPTLGKHDFVWLEQSHTPSGGGNMVWVGTGSSVSIGASSGISGHVMI